MARDAGGGAWLAEGVRGIEEVDPVRWGVVGEENVETTWWRAAGARGTWFIPNGRTWTARLLRYDMRTPVMLDLWLEGDERSQPGRRIDLGAWAVVTKA